MNALTADFDLLQDARVRATQQAQTIRTLQHDCLVLAMGLYGQNESTMAVEVCRVLEKYRVAVELELGLRDPELYDMEPTDEQMAACTRKTRTLAAVDRAA